MSSTAIVRERHLLSQSNLESHCNRSWPDKVTVDISLLLKPRDEEEPASATSRITASTSPVATARSVPTPVNAASLKPTRTTTIRAVPAKRPASSFDGPNSEAPAKKQSKWSPEEDAKIIQLRGEGMKWEDISRLLPGRSPISCRLHYQNYLERRSEWDEDRKNKLARLYERFKAEMWQRIAEEMAIPWRAAEAMHWQMGEKEMATRAGTIPFSLTTNNNIIASNMEPGLNGIAGSRAHHMRRNSATARLRRDTAPQMIQLPPQLPSLAELTAGIPAYSPHSIHPRSSHGHNRSFNGALTPPHLYHHLNSHRLIHDFDPDTKVNQEYQQTPASR